MCTCMWVWRSEDSVQELFFLLWDPGHWFRSSSLATGAFTFGCHTGPALVGFCVGFIFETKKHVARCPWTHCAAQASVRFPMLLPHLSSTGFQTCAATPVLEHSFLAVHWRKSAEASGSLLVLLEWCINTWDYSAVWSGRVVISSPLLLGECVSPSGREELH